MQTDFDTYSFYDLKNYVEVKIEYDLNFITSYFIKDNLPLSNIHLVVILIALGASREEIQNMTYAEGLTYVHLFR